MEISGHEAHLILESENSLQKEVDIRDKHLKITIEYGKVQNIIVNKYADLHEIYGKRIE